MRPHEKSGHKVTPRIKKWTSTKPTFCLKLFQMTPCHLLGNMIEKHVWNSCDKPAINIYTKEYSAPATLVPLGAIESMTTNQSTRGAMIHALGLDQWWVPKSMKSPMIAHALVQCFGHQWTTCCDGCMGPAWKAAAAHNGGDTYLNSSKTTQRWNYIISSK